MDSNLQSNLMRKSETINKIYYDPAGHESMKTTYEDAKQKDKSISYVDVEKWFDANIERTKTQLKGYNSFIASEPKEESQMDLVFMNYLQDPEFNIGLRMVDIFSKFVSIIPMQANNAPSILEAMQEAITKWVENLKLFLQTMKVF